MLTTKTLNEFLNELASNSPAPGGGSVAALAGAMGTALTSMVCNLTIGKKKYAEVEGEIKTVLEQAESLRQKLKTLIDQDTEAFNKVIEALSLPKETDEQKALRSAAIQSTTKDAARVPLEVMRLCLEGLSLAKTVAEKGNVNSVSDAGVSAIMFYGGLESAALNVQINLGSLQDKGFVENASSDVHLLQKEGVALLQAILTVVRGRMVKPV
jgi:formiminotetrahydrofolate cyclodeaminase